VPTSVPTPSGQAGFLSRIVSDPIPLRLEERRLLPLDRQLGVFQAGALFLPALPLLR
jgi:hypothetical protein